MRSPKFFLAIASAALPLTASAEFCPNRAAAVSTLQSNVFMDFDGDGESEIVTARSNKDGTTYRFLNITTGAVREVSLPAGKAVPGDYDGDGTWDAAVVRKTGKSLTWEWIDSSTGQTQTRTFGRAGVTVLSGCRFVSGSRYSLAYIKDRRLFAMEPGSEGSARVGFKKLESDGILGCGDPTGDGSDEPLFRTTSKLKGNDALVTVGCGNQLIVYRNIKSFKNGAIAPLQSPDFPLVIIQRKRGSKITVSIEAIAEVFSMPQFTVPAGTIFSFGSFKSNDVSTPYIVWQEPSGIIKRLALIEGNQEVLTVGQAEAQFKLVRTQFVDELK